MPEKRQFAVIGLGRFGYSVARTLVEKGMEVLAIDNDPEKVQAVSDFVTLAVECDATDEKALRAAGIHNVDAAVVSIGENIEASILIVMTLIDMDIKEVIAKAVSPIHGKVLRNIGASRIVFPERDMAVRVAASLVTPATIEELELSPYYSIVEFPAPEVIVGKTLRESRLRSDFGVNVVAIRRKVPFVREYGETDFTEEWNVTPSPDERIEDGDVLVVIGAKEKIKMLRKE
mgnify:CR=1 FL=1